MMAISQTDIIIVGAGLIGLSSAHALASRGRRVSVIDARPGPGEGASYKNSGMIHPGQGAPWFLTANAHLSAEARSAAAISNFRLGAYSQGLMTGPHLSNLRSGGTVALLPDTEESRAFLDMQSELESDGLSLEQWSAKDLKSRMPHIDPADIQTCLHYPTDLWGDAHDYAKNLAARVEALGVSLRYNTDVDAVEYNAGKPCGVRVPSGEILGADQVVIASGHLAGDTLQDGAVIGVRGYAVDIPCEALALLPHPVMDFARHGTLTPLPGYLRLSGTVDEGRGTDARKAAVAPLWAMLDERLPEHADTLRAEAGAVWTGYRPVSRDGKPYIGLLDTGLAINTGHSHMGWTQCAGSGEMLADILCGDAPAIDAAPFNPQR